MAADNLDSANLKAVAHGGIINEDVMQQLWDISNVPLPFTGMIGTPDTVGNSYTSWVLRKLGDPDLTNAQVDGADTAGNQDATPAGPRVGNHCQISTKTVKVSTRAYESDTIGYANELVEQVMERQKELRRDVEAISLSNQGSQEDDGNTTPGNSAGFAAWLTSNIDIPGDGTAGGFSGGTVTQYTPGTARGGTETALRDIVEKIYIAGGDPTQIMSVPTTIRRLNEFMFNNSAKIATLQSDAGQSESQMVAKGSVNVYIADHGQVLAFVPNRIQQTYAAATATTGSIVYIFDPDYARHGHLHGYRTEPLAKTGLAEKRQLAVDWTLKVLNEESHGMMADIDPAAAWTA